MKKINEFVKEIQLLSKQQNKQKQFGWLLIGIWLVVFYLKLKQNNFDYQLIEKWFYGFPIVLIIITSLVTRLLQPILFVWFLIGKILGLITSFIILFVSYYVILLPIVFISNIFTKKEEPKVEWLSKTSSIDYKKLY
jgi:phosphatidylserine synthase